MDDQRSAVRTKTSKVASIFFGRRTDAHACDVEVTDLADGGARIYKRGLAILPLTFELSFDNLRRNCRMVWRKGNSFGVTFENQNSPALNKPDVGGSLPIEESMFSTLGEPLQLARFDESEALTEFSSKIVERNNSGGSDVRFTVGVAIVLALPVLISIGAYVATTVVLSAG
jgi:hypothetical protein